MTSNQVGKLANQVPVVNFWSVRLKDKELTTQVVILTIWRANSDCMKLTIKRDNFQS